MVALLGLLWFVAGCPVGQHYDRRRAPSTGARPQSLVETLARYDQLGDAWQQLSGPRSVHDVYATMDGERALIRLRGWGGPALWYDQGAFAPALLGNEPTFIDPAQGLMYKIEQRPEEKTDQLKGYLLPRRELTVTHDIPAGRLLSLAPQPAEQCAWFAIRRPAVEERAASIEIGWFDADQLFGVSLNLEQNLVPPEVARLAPLSSGGAVVEAGGAIYLVDRDGTQGRLNYTLPPDRDSLLAADGSDARVFWVHLAPLAEPILTSPADDGNPKQAIGERLPGELIAVDLEGSELARLPTGAGAFSSIAGDWAERRALLAQKDTGVAVADFEQRQLSWLLRQDAATPAYLLPGGQVWAFADDRIVAVSAAELLELAPKLTAGEMLNRDQAERLKPVTEALGWKWGETQVSPLTGGEGELTFLNTGDLSASLAEFVWDIENQRVKRLHLARTPSATDLELLTLAGPEGSAPPGKHLLTALGWPDAEWLADESFSAADELRALYELRPGERPPGTYALWITAAATFMQLDSEGTFEPEPAFDPDAERAAHLEGHLHSEDGEATTDKAESGPDIAAK